MIEFLDNDLSGVAFVENNELQGIDSLKLRARVMGHATTIDVLASECFRNIAIRDALCEFD